MVLYGHGQVESVQEKASFHRFCDVICYDYLQQLIEEGIRSS